MQALSRWAGWGSLRSKTGLWSKKHSPERRRESRPGLPSSCCRISAREGQNLLTRVLLVRVSSGPRPRLWQGSSSKPLSQGAWQQVGRAGVSSHVAVALPPVPAPLSTPEQCPHQLVLYYPRSACPLQAFQHLPSVRNWPRFPCHRNSACVPSAQRGLSLPGPTPRHCRHSPQSLLQVSLP